MKWRRTPHGYVSSDLQWFLERGARMTHGANAWLIWRRATEADFEPWHREHFETYGSWPYPLRTLAEISGAPEGDIVFIDACTEGGWLSEAKATVEILQKERNS